jgi:hypothetical protein
MAAAGLVAAFLAIPGQSRAQGASTPTATTATTAQTSSGKVGVAPLAAPGLSAELRGKLEDAAAAGLRASGAEVVSTSQLSRTRSTAGLGACTDTACEQKLAQLTDTRTWLRGSVALDTSTYRIHLELTDARSGSVLSARDDTCDICTEADATEAVNMAASTLQATMKTKAAAKAIPAATPPLARATTAAAPPTPASSGATGGSESGTPVPLPDTGASDGAVDQDGSSRPVWLRVLPWVAFAGAAWALGTGAYYWSIDGTSRPCSPQPCNSTATVATEKYVFTGAGVVLAAAGVALLLLPNPAPAATESHAHAPSRAATAQAARSLGVGVWGHGLTLSGQF